MKRLTHIGLLVLSLFVFGACANQETKDQDEETKKEERVIRAFEFRNPRL
jgi:hypothetical protein